PEPAGFHGLKGPMLVLPTDVLADMRTMLWSTDGYPAVVNGGEGFALDRLSRAREAGKHFPDQDSVQALRDIGVRSVVVVRSQAVGTEFERATNGPIDGLDITRTESGDLVIYTLTG